MLKRYLPILDWGARYGRETLGADLMAAVIVTIMLIPQSLAYAMLAGLPPEVGLYASIAPLLLYGVFGTSRALAVGPVAVVSLMTAAAVGQVAEVGTPEYYGAALALALLSGLMLVAMGVLKLGFLANFLSHPVVAGFITASGVIIAAGQLKHILGVKVAGESLPETVWGLVEAASSANLVTLAIGAGAAGFLYWARRRLKPLLVARGLAPRLADAVAKAGPVAAVAATTLLSWGLDLQSMGVAIVGDVPSGLPPISAPPLDLGLWTSLLGSALLISVIGFVESVSVAQTLAAKRRQRIHPDQELIGLGAANIGAAFTGGYPVTGGFARSVVNFDAGAETPAAGAFTAVGIALATLFLTPLLHFLPVATLAATIIVAVLSLVDFGSIRRTWVYSRSDALAAMATIGLTWVLGVEAGVIAGVAVSIGLHLWRTSQPHCAIVGQVPGTEHFRNVDRHNVVTVPDLVTLRVDESLWFPNARFLEDKLLDLVAGDCALRDIVLMCPAVNSIDASALESLEEINRRLKDAGVTLHLSEVKGPVMDRLKKTHFLDELTGRVFLTQFDAIRALRPEIAAATLRSPRCETAKAAE
ncbi:SulP family inorganic anion transporter [Albimonas pacifica]|uniref:Sulfate permease, SulP family n=1 Tax=Albimonas pacifica TaxID=1114924 RepID=A0A1I3MLF0_9RHOB|nr:sulfate permease [Albimonas pacifica]SFI97837.1 sulfate permease, SulP family [Albimonas pacifica]